MECKINSELPVSGRGHQNIESIDYEIIIETDQSDHQSELLHENVKKYGTVFNTVAPGTVLRRVPRRKGTDE